VSKEELLIVQGIVSEVLPDSRYSVILDNSNHKILAYAAGRMKKNHIRILEGDKVTVEMSTYDLNKGRITFRYK
jgi:translation initiation factor IF-1